MQGFVRRAQSKANIYRINQINQRTYSIVRNIINRKARRRSARSSSKFPRNYALWCAPNRVVITFDLRGPRMLSRSPCLHFCAGRKMPRSPRRSSRSRSRSPGRKRYSRRSRSRSPRDRRNSRSPRRSSPRRSPPLRRERDRSPRRSRKDRSRSKSRSRSRSRDRYGGLIFLSCWKGTCSVDDPLPTPCLGFDDHYHFSRFGRLLSRRNDRERDRERREEDQKRKKEDEERRLEEDRIRRRCY